MSAALQRFETAVSSNTVASVRIQAALSVVSELILEQHVDGLKEVLSCLFASDAYGSLLCRPVVKHIVSTAPEALGTDALSALWEYLLTLFKGRVGAYEEEELRLRDQLATLRAEAGNFSGAAQCLEVFETANDQGSFDLKRLERAERIIRLYLRAGDVAAAEHHFTRIFCTLDEIDQPSELWVDVQALHAELLLRKLATFKAARKYLDLSRNTLVLADPNRALRYFNYAAGCVLLAPAGPARALLVAALVHDERLSTVPLGDILHRVFAGGLVEYTNVLELMTRSLGGDFLAQLPGSHEALRRALIDHNILAISELYKSISYDSLADLLATTPENAERAAALMIRQERLPNALLDGEKRCLKFSVNKSNAVQDMNSRIGEILMRLDDVVSSFAG